MFSGVSGIISGILLAKLPYAWWGGALLFLLACALLGYLSYRIRGPFKLRKTSPLSRSDQYALALGAHLAIPNGALLNDWPLKAGRISVWWVLRSSWGVKNKEQALALMDTMFEQSLDAEEQLPSEKAIAYFGKKRLNVNYPINTVAWDLGRLVNVARWSERVGYISKDELRRRIVRAAQLAQHHYQSWEEFSLGYLIGRFEWGGRDSMMDDLVRISSSLLEHPRSPWVKLPWNEPLTLPDMAGLSGGT